jgi:hypothetical protein
VLPPDGAVDEPAWLEQLRLREIEGWTEQHDDEVAQVKSFQFRLDSISLNLGAYVYGEESNEQIDDPNDFLLLLEGLDWK